jgi:hypothetical protein
MTADHDREGPDRRRVRPYAMTGGRTQPTRDDLPIEALVSTLTVTGPTPKLTVEQRAIAALCQDSSPSLRCRPGSTSPWA